jgi:hypothetical protein
VEYGRDPISEQSMMENERAQTSEHLTFGR